MKIILIFLALNGSEVRVEMPYDALPSAAIHAELGATGYDHCRAGARVMAHSLRFLLPLDTHLRPSYRYLCTGDT